jgi:hypothetical protein
LIINLLTFETKLAHVDIAQIMEIIPDARLIWATNSNTCMQYACLVRKQNASDVHLIVFFFMKTFDYIVSWFEECIH